MTSGGFIDHVFFPFLIHFLSLKNALLVIVHRFVFLAVRTERWQCGVFARALMTGGGHLACALLALLSVVREKGGLSLSLSPHTHTHTDMRVPQRARDSARTFGLIGVYETYFSMTSVCLSYNALRGLECVAENNFMTYIQFMKALKMFHVLRWTDQVIVTQIFYSQIFIFLIFKSCNLLTGPHSTR